MKLPTVVIIGRPNVGKSTLFNRLVGKQEAIVDNVSGVTRDRNYGDVVWNGKVFRIIDTGGYVPDSNELFERIIREQVQFGIDEADKIILVVDAKTGENPFDQEISELIRNSGKPCMLLVNKIDADVHNSLMHDFYGLGIFPVFPVSATTGRGTGDFLDEITSDFPVNFNDEEEDGEVQLKLALVGRPNVGKSSLTNALLGYDRSIVTDIPGTTRDSVDSVLKYYGEEITLIDTAGLRKRTRVKEQIEYFSTVRTMKAIAESTVSVVIIDATQGFEKQDQKIIDEAVQRRKGIILAVNKWDLIEKDSNTAHQFEKSLKQKMGSLHYIPVIFISALTKQRIYKLIDLAKEVHAQRRTKIPTSELNEYLLDIIRSTTPPSTPTGKEIRIKYITQVGLKYPIFLCFANQAKYIPDSYRRFLEGKIREKWGFSGVPFTLSFKDKNKSEEGGQYNEDDE